MVTSKAAKHLLKSSKVIKPSRPWLRGSSCRSSPWEQARTDGVTQSTVQKDITTITPLATEPCTPLHVDAIKLPDVGSHIIDDQKFPGNSSVFKNVRSVLRPLTGSFTNVIGDYVDAQKADERPIKEDTKVQITISLDNRKISKVQRIIGYKFNDQCLLREALQCPGAGSDEIGTRYISSEGNKRLAIIGDVVLKLAIAEEWYKSKNTRCAMDRRISRVGSNENLKAIGERLGLDSCMVKNGSQIASKLDVFKTKSISDTVEAILGAVYLDVEPAHRMRNISAVMLNIGLL